MTLGRGREDDEYAQQVTAANAGITPIFQSPSGVRHGSLLSVRPQYQDHNKKTKGADETISRNSHDYWRRGPRGLHDARGSNRSIGLCAPIPSCLDQDIRAGTACSVAGECTQQDIGPGAYFAGKKCPDIPGRLRPTRGQRVFPRVCIRG